jgi:CcmD family protein
MADNSTYIIAAYTITWLTLIAYLVHLRRARRDAERRYRDAQRATGGSV